MSSTHGRSSSHAPSRPPSAHHHHHRTISAEHRRHSQQGLQAARDASAGAHSHKRRADHGPAGETKRRRPNNGVLSADELLTPSIVVRAHPPNPLSRPCTLLPLMLLPREHLPLASLDLAAPMGNLPNCRTYQSEIRILELEGRLGSNVLIARSPSSNAGSSGGFSSASSLFAIERDAAGLYVMCKLGSWVDIHGLSENATAVCQQRMPARPKEAASHEGHEGHEGHVLVTARADKDRGKKRLAIAELQSFVRRKPALQPASEGAAAAAADGGEVPAQTVVVTGPESEDAAESSFVSVSNDAAGDLPARPVSQASAHTLADSFYTTKEAGLPTPPASDSTKAVPAPQVEPPAPTGPPTAADIFQNIRHQYLEALYHSMGSLAYFAKGPLSRARAAFHLDCDANLEMDDLVDFLKSLVLTTTVIDKKYRETVPELVARLRTLGSLSDHDEPKRKSKKPKKMKLGSNGLYTDEDMHIQKWWDANKPPPRDDEVFPRSEEVKYVISRLRTRETQMQMILILEIMALDAMQPASDAVESQLPGMAPDDGPAAAAAAPASKKEASRKRSKSKHNFPLLIDVHADRLCIWQSTISDDVRALAESQARPNGDFSALQSSQSLKDFCVDIIVPFFYPRLPLVCDSLNRKLGGPVIAAPGSRTKSSSHKPSSGSHSHRSSADHKSRDKASSSASASAASSSRPLPRSAKPGSSLRRTASASTSAQSLERVLSNERLRRSVSRGPNDAIAQLRSATAAAVPGLKREASEPAALASIPHRSSSSSGSLQARPTNSLARSCSDVGASAGATARLDDTRARKKALVEAQLQEAISALKKPNRELVGKAVVEDAEKRLFGSQAKKLRKMARPLAAADTQVQVKATPVTNRFRDVYVSAPTTDSQGLFGTELANRQQRPGASARPDLHHEFVATSPRVAATPSACRIQATPMRATAASFNKKSVPDSAIKAPASLPSREALTSASGNLGLSRSTAVPPFPDNDNDNDRVLGSSPLQARSSHQPSVFRQAERTSVFETPTKNRTIHLEGAMSAAQSILATPPAARPAAVAAVATVAPSGGMGNGIQSLYQKMGWDDDVDDLA